MPLPLKVPGWCTDPFYQMPWRQMALSRQQRNQGLFTSFAGKCGMQCVSLLLSILTRCYLVLNCSHNSQAGIFKWFPSSNLTVQHCQARQHFKQLKMIIDTHGRWSDSSPGAKQKTSLRYSIKWKAHGAYICRYTKFTFSRRYDSDYQWGEGLEVEDRTEKGIFYFSFHAFS